MTPMTLSQFRARFPGCDVALYADIASGTVLASDTGLNMPQEYLDALCDAAATLLAVPQPRGDTPTQSVVVFSEVGGRVFLRAPNAPSEALCCICSPDADAERLLDDMRALFGPDMPGT